MEKYTFGISSCGYCPRRLSYRYLGYEALPAPRWLETSAEEGKWHEERIIAQLEAGELDIPEYGSIPWLIGCRQKEFNLEYPTFALKGHIEGTAIPIPKGWCPERPDHPYRPKENLLEIKSTSQFEFDRWVRGRFDEFPAYGDQVACYAVSSRLNQVLYIVKNRNNGYIDRREIALEASVWQATVDSVARRLARLVEHIQHKELYPAEFDPTSWECRRCEFRQHCTPPPPVLALNQEKDLMEVTEKWRRGKALATEGTELVDEAKEVLRAYAETMPTQKLVFNDVITSIYLVHGSTTYPKAKVEELLPPEKLTEIAKVAPDRYDCKVTDLARREDNG